MAITPNLKITMAPNARIALGGPIAQPLPITASASAPPIVVQAPAVVQAAAAQPPKALSLSPAALALNPNLVAAQVNLLQPSLSPVFIQKTTTQIAQGALGLLNSASQAVLQRAINPLKSRNLAAGSLMNYFERKVKIGEVLTQLAAHWTAETQQDFADAFQMPKNDLEAMDAIVSIAILNDPELEGELMEENAAEPTQNDLLENRRIVSQYPPAGTVLQPPYLVLLAVEYRDTQHAQEVIQSILGALVDYQGYKLPRAAVQKLSGSAPTPPRPIVPSPNLASALNLKLNT